MKKQVKQVKIEVYQCSLCEEQMLQFQAIVKHIEEYHKVDTPDWDKYYTTIDLNEIMKRALEK